jgi:hypothetical protein
MRDGDGRALHPAAVGGLIVGIAALYLTSLLVSI